MARKRMVTRSVPTTIVTLLCLDTERAEPFNRTVTLSGVFKDKKAILKAAKSVVEDEIVSVAKIVDVEVEEKLYGMEEQYFIDHATILPPRASKVSE